MPGDSSPAFVALAFTPALAALESSPAIYFDGFLAGLAFFLGVIIASMAEAASR